MASAVRERTSCRICGSVPLEEVFDLGMQYIASRFPRPEEVGLEPGPFPLVLVRCSAPHGCGLVQLKHTVDPTLMYSQYGYLSGINESMRDHLANITATAQSWKKLAADDIVVDIGCNDGTLLNSYQTASSVVRIGFEPAANAADVARQTGIKVFDFFFGDEKGVLALGGAKASIVTSIAMFYDLEDPKAFASSVRDILDDSGIWILEMSYLPMMIAKKSFDTICHEHLEYYAFRQIEWLLEDCGLTVLDVTTNEINGGSFQIVAGHRGHWSDSSRRLNTIETFRKRESELALTSTDTYRKFAADCAEIRDTLKELVLGLVDEGRTVVGYGASTKGNTLLQYCGFTAHQLKYLVDRNAWKWGRVSPGTGIPIVSEAEFHSLGPNEALVLPWHFLKGFLERESDFINAGGRFIVPLPNVEFVQRKDE